MLTLILKKKSVIKDVKKISENQCKNIGHTSYKYKVCIHAGKNLDENGFMIDHAIVHRVVDETIRTKMGSCEQLCLSVYQALRKILIEEHGLNPIKDKIKIRPVDSNAWVELDKEFINDTL